MSGPCGTRISGCLAILISSLAWPILQLTLHQVITAQVASDCHQCFCFTTTLTAWGKSRLIPVMANEMDATLKRQICLGPVG